MLHHSYHDALVIIAKIGNNNVNRILSDNRSVSDVLYFNSYKRMRLRDEYLRPIAIPFYGFTGDSLMP